MVEGELFILLIFRFYLNFDSDILGICFHFESYFLVLEPQTTLLVEIAAPLNFSFLKIAVHVNFSFYSKIF